MKKNQNKMIKKRVEWAVRSDDEEDVGIVPDDVVVEEGSERKQKPFPQLDEEDISVDSTLSPLTPRSSSKLRMRRTVSNTEVLLMPTPTKPLRQQIQRRLNQQSFQALRITKGDHFLTGYDKYVGVCVDVFKRTIEITLDLEGNRLVIDWDDISGLDYQYSPLAPAIIVIELRKRPAICPHSFSSVVYFLYCSKQDCATFMDEGLLKYDQRLLKLAIQSLPTWSVVVNRYSVPIYYSSNMRQIISVLVNIYIMFSLVWGFYDLYKNLPYVGGALRALFGPFVKWIEPLFRNRVVLLVPLLLSRLYELTLKIYTAVEPILFSVQYWLSPVFWGILHILSPIVTLGKQLASLFYYLIYPFVYIFSTVATAILELSAAVYTIIYPVISVIAAIVTFMYQVVKLIGTLAWTIVKLPVQLIVMIYDLVAVALFSIKDLVMWLWNGHLISMVSLIFTAIGSLVKFVYDIILHPISKMKYLFSLADMEHASRAAQAISNVVASGTETVSSVNEMNEYRGTMKESLRTASAIWAAFRRIIDTIIHTYHTKIKHHSTFMKRILIAFLLLAITSVLVLIFYLVL